MHKTSCSEELYSSDIASAGILEDRKDESIVSGEVGTKPDYQEKDFTGSNSRTGLLKWYTISYWTAKPASGALHTHTYLVILCLYICDKCLFRNLFAVQLAIEGEYIIPEGCM